jgi:hypothetical protein
MQSEQSAVILSRGGAWNPEPHEPPYLVARPGNEYPKGATARIDFTDTSGASLATFDGTVTPEAIRFFADPDEVDGIPAGANYEITLETLDSDYKIRYGKVIRREVTYFPPPAVNVTPMAFGDNFQRTALGRKWIAVAGRTRIFDNSGLSLPNGATVDGAFFTKSAIRYYQPFTTDSIRMNVTVQNPFHLLSGKTSFVVGSDANMTSGLAMQLETGLTNNWVHMGVLNGPTSVTYEGSSVSNVASSGDNYSINYNDSTKTMSVYKGTNLTPLAEWTDDTGIVPHGPGYRYVGFIFESSLVTAGIQVSSWSAKDGS